MADRLAPLKDVSPTLLMALLAMLCPGTAHSALPPPPPLDARKPESATSSAKAESEEEHIAWTWPPIRYGGTLMYTLRRDMSDAQDSMQSGQTGTFRVSTNGFIWQPWFARVNGALGLTLSRNSSDTNQDSSSSKSVIITGSGQLSVLDKSRYPFEAHFTRTDSRVSTDLALENGYASNQYGFTQRYLRPAGDATFSWNRSAQTSADDRRDQQDSLQLSLLQRFKNHHLQLNGNRSDNTRASSDEQAVQTNLTVQDNYTPNTAFSVASLVNLSGTDYRLLQGESQTRLLQVSSLASWRPTSKPLTIIGGVRVFALELDRSDFSTNSNPSGARIYNANANIGMNYTVNRFLRLNAGANVNMSETNGEKTTNSNQSFGANYTPDAIQWRSFRYNWSASGTVTNQTGTSAGHQEALQLSHNLGRSYKSWGGSTISVNGSQSLSTVFGNGGADMATGSGQRLTNSGSVSWDIYREARRAQVHLSVSDSRALGGGQNSFQLVNLQASGQLPSGQFANWVGNLTIQATRQNTNVLVSTTDPNPVTYTTANNKFISSSSGSVSYQNQRFLGVHRLNFTSDLRLNSQALLPLLGNAKDQATAAWQNRWNYFIGRTQLQLAIEITRNAGQKNSIDPITGEKKVEGESSVNKSILFSVTRNFGN